MLLIGWGPKFYQHHDRILHIQQAGFTPTMGLLYKKNQYNGNVLLDKSSNAVAMQYVGTTVNFQKNKFYGRRFSSMRRQKDWKFSPKVSLSCLHHIGVLSTMHTVNLRRKRGMPHRMIAQWSYFSIIIFSNPTNINSQVMAVRAVCLCKPKNIENKLNTSLDHRQSRNLRISKSMQLLRCES